MEFGFSAAETAFADEVRRFLREHPLESFLPDGMDAGYGSGSHSRAFMKALAERGWISIGWPAAVGGLDRPLFVKLLLLEELGLPGAPLGPPPGPGAAAGALLQCGRARP